MGKAQIIAEWVEISQSYFSDKQPLSAYEAILVLNRCEVRETASGRYLQRVLGTESIKAKSKDEMEKAVGEFVLQDNVRVLVKGLEPNDCDSLPRKTKNVPSEMLVGTADIYIPKDSIGEARRRDDAKGDAR